MRKKEIIERISYWSQLLLLPVYWFSFFVPRNRKLWLFGSTFGRRFADNPRYMYLYASQHKKKLGIRPIWISHNKEIIRFLNRKNYEAYYYHSLKGIWFALRGKVYLFDNYSKDINFWQSGGAIKINLWHGIPLKKIQADNIFDKVRHPKNSLERWKSFPRRLSDEKATHYVLTTSRFLIPIFSSAFCTRKILTSGYPRNDRLVEEKIENILTDAESYNKAKIEAFLLEKNVNKEAAKNKKMIYYMPTFRDSETKFFQIMDLGKFQQFLKRNNLLFCVKLHPKSKLEVEFKRIEGGNIQVIDRDSDPYVFLEVADVLVTDYSSIYFDFLLADKPIVFFDYDLEEYLQDSREMYFDYQGFTPGEKAATEKELEKALIAACYPDETYERYYGNFRRKIKEKVFDQTEGLASKRLVEDIKDILKKENRIL